MQFSIMKTGLLIVYVNKFLLVEDRIYLLSSYDFSYAIMTDLTTSIRN